MLKIKKRKSPNFKRFDDYPHIENLNNGPKFYKAVRFFDDTYDN